MINKNAFIFPYVYHRSLLFVSSVSAERALFFSRFSDEHQEGVEAKQARQGKAQKNDKEKISASSPARRTVSCSKPASRLSEKRVAPVLQASTTGPLHLPVKP